MKKIGIILCFLTSPIIWAQANVRPFPLYLATAADGALVEGSKNQSDLQNAIGLGSGVAILLVALISSSENDVFQAYHLCQDYANKLNIDIPLPPSGNLESRSAEGFLYALDLSGNIRRSLGANFGARVTSGYTFSFSVLTANTFAERPSFREKMLEHAVGAADILNLPIEFVSEVLQTVEEGKGKAGMVLFRQMERLKTIVR